MIKKQPMGTAIPCSSMVQINLPGGVIQLVTGFKIQATSRITMPIVPLKVKKPPISVFFIASTSFYIRRYYRLALTNYKYTTTVSNYQVFAYSSKSGYSSSWENSASLIAWSFIRALSVSSRSSVSSGESSPRISVRASISPVRLPVL